MYIPLKNRFRQDLIVTSTSNKDNSAKRYSIKDPSSGETFEFGEEEYFLCKSMDGTSSITQILTGFENRFGLSITNEDFNRFAAQIAEFSLLESCHKQTQASLSVSLIETPDSLSPMMSATKIREEDRELPAEPNTNDEEKEKSEFLIWSLSNPETFFIQLVQIVRPFKTLFKGLAWSLIPGLIIVYFTITNNSSAFLRDVTLLVKPIAWLFYHFLNMLFINLTSKLSLGIICTYYGGTVKRFGIQLILGFVPRFHVSKNGIWRLKREEQLWAFGTSLGIRIFIFVLGILIWYWTRSLETDLKIWALSLGYMGLIDCLIDCSPFWPSDGYRLVIAYFRLPRNFIQQNLLIWEMMLNRRSLPKGLTFQERLRLQVWAVVIILSWAGFMLLLAYHLSDRLLNGISPGILGKGATVLLFGVPFGLALYTWWSVTKRKTKTSSKKGAGTVNHSKLRHSLNQSGVSEWSSVANIPRHTKDLASIDKKHKSWVRKLVKFFLLVGFGILLCLPYPYRPGGSIQLLPPTQQQIQAQVDGQITQVFFKGGDGQWIKAGTVIANMEAFDIENAVLTTQEQVRQQQAEVERQQANLDKLLATPKKEDVEVAKQKVEVAKQQVEVAKQQVEVAQGELQTAISKAEFSSRQAARYKDLYTTGAFSLQQYENAQKEAETDRNTVAEKKQNVEQKKQDVETKRQNLKEEQAHLALVASGPYPQEIEAARKEVEAAKATFKRLQQQLKYNQDQIKRTPLVMPLDGYLVTSYLNQKVGTYLKKGETFAVAENNRHIQGEVRIPEYNVSDFSIGRTVEVKLLAYPNQPIIGKVVSIEPIATTDSSLPTSDSTGLRASSESTSTEKEHVVRVLVDISNTQKNLKAGMSGYAKIEGRSMPVIAAFTRSIVRFVQIEVWSWLP